MYLGTVGIAVGKALFAELFQIFIAVGFTLGQLEARQVIVAELEIKRAFFGDLHRVVGGLGMRGQKGAHLLLALQIELARLKAHAVRIINGLAHLDAHENVLIIGIIPLCIMRVVREGEGDARFRGELDELRGGALFLGDIVILYFKIEIVPEKAFQLKRLCLGGLIITADEPLRDIARETAGQTYEPLRVTAQERPVDAGLDIITVRKSGGYHVAEVPVAELVLAEEDEVGIIIVSPVLLVRHVARGNVDLAADDRLYSLRAARLIERDRAVHYAVVGDGKRTLPHSLGALCGLVYAARPVKQGIFAMHMKVNKSHFGLSFSQPEALSININYIIV